MRYSPHQLACFACKLVKSSAPRIEFTWHCFDKGDEVTDSAFRAIRGATVTRKPAPKRKSA